MTSRSYPRDGQVPATVGECWRNRLTSVWRVDRLPARGRAAVARLGQRRSGGDIMKWSRLLALVLVAVAPTVVTAEAAEAALPTVVASCGMVITSSVKLANDLSCDSETALGISPPLGHGIIVDLGGHTVAATNTSFAVASQTAGTHATVRNGRIAGGLFDIGGGASHALFQNLVLDGQGTDETGEGVAVVVDTVEVKSCQFINGATVGGRLASLRVRTSTFIGNGTSSPAIDVTNPSAGSLVDLFRNRISGYDTGISVAGDVDTDLKIRDNHVIGAVTGLRIGGAAAAGTITGSVTGNHVDEGRGDGILIGDGSAALFQSNHVKRNGADGIHIDPTGGAPINVTLTNNVANQNAALGIDAPASDPPNVIITDGGSNRARRNLGGQCTNIAC